jgi:hypothetical protein
MLHAACVPLGKGGYLKRDVANSNYSLVGAVDRGADCSTNLFTFRKNLASYIERSALINRSVYYPAANRPIYLAIFSLGSESFAQHRV